MIKILKKVRELRADGTLSPDGHLNVYKEGSQHSEKAKAEDGLVLGYKEMEELLETAEIDEDGFIKLKDGLKVKASDLREALEDNKAVENDLNTRMEITQKGIRDFGYRADKNYLERLRAEMRAMSDGHVGYNEANELKNNIVDSYLGITRFEHNNMRTVLNKNWEYEGLDSKTLDAIQKDKNNEIKNVTYMGETWEKYKPGASVYHSPLGTGGDIIKLVNKETGREVVFDINTGEPILHNKYIGTFNYSSSVSHIASDMLPYVRWKNNTMDDSNLTWRIYPPLDKSYDFPQREYFSTVDLDGVF